jgi:hypothetical protein
MRKSWSTRGIIKPVAKLPTVIGIQIGSGARDNNTINTVPMLQARVV